ncbi:MAG: hypothetical protein Unbinned6284contig1004_49 [Prokaryotic dsDNA virus sp.]|nr:MAG: hypothetical protein Unbinned6284contig1004_49 [Prokaryotic dsDNA virus sp.]|tara:strand:+ start:7969 stop:8145 length:177 start_codon:yes stop_codon:yes gene_type:complete
MKILFKNFKDEDLNQDVVNIILNNLDENVLATSTGLIVSISKKDDEITVEKRVNRWQV